jgi:hypothetical protein
MGDQPRTAAKVRTAVYVWAILGVLILLGQGLAKLVPVAGQAVFGPLSLTERIALWSFVAVNFYLEGYRGFQLRFVPRVVSRAHYLASAARPPVWTLLLAPLFAMGYFHAKRRARVSAWIVSALIVLAIVAGRHLPHPWRGIVDAGVVAGLGYGTLVFLYQSIQCALTGTTRADAEVPSRLTERPTAEPSVAGPSAAPRPAERSPQKTAQPSKMPTDGAPGSETG